MFFYNKKKHLLNFYSNNYNTLLSSKKKKEGKMAEKIRIWKRYLENYYDIIGIECANSKSFYNLIDAIYKPNLIICPYEVVGLTVILPKSAKRYLIKIILNNKNYNIVSLRQSARLTKKVLNEIKNRRCDCRGKLNFYETEVILSKNFVLLDTIKEIRKELNIKKLRM